MAGDAKQGYLLITPTIVGLIALDVYPFPQTLVLSFSATHPSGCYEVSGVEDYVQMFGNKEFWKATWNSIYFCILTVPLGASLSLLTAMLLDAKIRAKAVFRIIYLLSMVVAPAAIVMVRKWTFSIEYGIISQIIGSRIDRLTDSRPVLPAYAVVAVWGTVGYDTILLLSGIQSISRSYYEAASLDGASRTQRFFKITLPMIPPILSVALIMRLMVSLKVCNLIYMMVDQTNPAFTNTQSLVYLFYRESSVVGNRGHAPATAVWTVLLVGTVAAPQLWGQKKWVSYEVWDGGKV